MQTKLSQWRRLGNWYLYVKDWLHSGLTFRGFRAVWAKWRHGVKSEEHAAVLMEGTDWVQLGHQVLITVALKELCGRLGLNYTETKFGEGYGRILRNELQSDEIEQVLNICFDPPKEGADRGIAKRRVVEAMIALGDINQRNLIYHFGSQEALEAWYNSSDEKGN